MGLMNWSIVDVCYLCQGRLTLATVVSGMSISDECYGCASVGVFEVEIVTCVFHVVKILLLHFMIST